MALQRIKTGEIRVGEALPWPVFDEKGMLLLAKGFVVSSQSQLSRLMVRGVYSQRNVAEREEANYADVIVSRQSPFHVFDDIQIRLRRVHEDLRTGSGDDLSGRIIKVCRELQRLCWMDANAVLGMVHLIHDGRYLIVHSLHTAILAELSLAALDVHADDRLPVLAAALTHDVGMKEEFYKQSAPLSGDQWEEVHRHTLRSVEILEENGVEDEVWLDTVLHHHERLDGSGYPFKRSGDNISLPVRILSIADSYSAMIKQRSYRQGLLAKEALRDIFLKQAGQVDNGLVKRFVGEMGVFPPGAFVRLHNSEVAVVTHRGSGVATPIAHAVISPRGAPLEKPVQRDTSESEFAITEMVARDKAVPLNMHSLWGYA